MYEASDVLFFLFEESLAVIAEHLIDLLSVHAFRDLGLAMEVVLLYCPVRIDTPEHANANVSSLDRLCS